MNQLINCTPHALTLRNAAGVDTIIPPSGIVPRVDNTPGTLDPDSPLAGIVDDFTADQVGEVVGMPDPEPGKIFIVSGMVGDALPFRPDVRVPGTGPRDGAIRNEKGHIVAVTRLKQLRR